MEESQSMSKLVQCGSVVFLIAWRVLLVEPSKVHGSLELGSDLHTASADVGVRASAGVVLNTDVGVSSLLVLGFTGIDSHIHKLHIAVLLPLGSDGKDLVVPPPVSLVQEPHRDLSCEGIVIGP